MVGRRTGEVMKYKVSFVVDGTFLGTDLTADLGLKGAIREIVTSEVTQKHHGRPDSDCVISKFEIEEER